MELSAELSLYPLTGDVDTSVLAFIDDLHSSGPNLSGHLTP
jgi:hypothetical protein